MKYFVASLLFYKKLFSKDKNRKCIQIFSNRFVNTLDELILFGQYTVLQECFWLVNTLQEYFWLVNTLYSLIMIGQWSIVAYFRDFSEWRAAPLGSQNFRESKQNQKNKSQE